MEGRRRREARSSAAGNLRLKEAKPMAQVQLPVPDGGDQIRDGPGCTINRRGL